MQKALVLVLTQDNSPKQQQSTAAASTAATNGGNTLSFIKKTRQYKDFNNGMVLK